MTTYRHTKLTGSKSEVYRQLAQMLEGLLEGEADVIANLANAAALLGCQLERINWVGFYVSDGGGGLVLGPFQGKPACTRIMPGRGVCGSAAAARRTVIVPDVHDFPGHIACDEESRSEIVVPILHARGEVYGVLDIDSPVTGRFDEGDASGLEQLVDVLRRHLRFA